MSIELHLVARQAIPEQEPSVRLLRPSAGGMRRQPKQGRLHMLAMPLVVAAHVLIIAALLLMRSDPVDLKQEPETPIVVSLVTDARSLAETPKTEQEPPKPVVINKPKPKPVQKVQPKPEPQQQVVQPTVPVESRQVEQPKSEPVAQPAAQPAPVQPSPPVEKAEKEPPPPESTEPEQVSGIAYLRQPELKYPSLSRRMKEEGVVMLHVVVNSKGEPESVEIKTSSGFTRLDNAALEAVKQSRFIPYKKNNKPVSAQAFVPIRFELN